MTHCYFVVCLLNNILVPSFQYVLLLKMILIWIKVSYGTFILLHRFCFNMVQHKLIKSKLTFHKALWYKRYLPLLWSALTFTWLLIEKINILLNLVSLFSERREWVGLLLSGFMSGHNFLTLLSGGHYFRKFTV